MIGKTIAHVEQQRYGDTILHFTDGTAVEIQAVGYEVEGVELWPITPADRRLRAARRQGERERQRLRDLHSLRHRVLRERDVAAHKAVLTEEEYQAWYQEKYGLKGFAKLLSEEFAGAIRDQLNDTTKLLLYGGKP